MGDIEPPYNSKYAMELRKIEKHLEYKKNRAGSERQSPRIPTSNGNLTKSLSYEDVTESRFLDQRESKSTALSQSQGNITFD